MLGYISIYNINVHKKTNILWMGYNISGLLIKSFWFGFYEANEYHKC